MDIASDEEGDYQVDLPDNILAFGHDFCEARAV